MDDGVNHKLERIVSALGDYIDLARSHAFHDTAQLLAMAKLDLQMRLHGITENELAALCGHLEGKGPRPQSGRTAEVVPFEVAARRRMAGDKAAAQRKRRRVAKSARLPAAW